MIEDQPVQCPFRAKLASIVGSVRTSTAVPSHEDTFEALSRLERRALIADASDPTLREIAEARFLVGILRESVRPLKPAAFRAILRAREASAAIIDRV